MSNDTKKLYGYDGSKIIEVSNPKEALNEKQLAEVKKRLKALEEFKARHKS